jgi:lactose/L-arabinose transport system permease protein
MRHGRALIAYGFMTPFIGAFALFWAWPILQSALFSLQNWRVSPHVFTPGLNWARLASDPLYHSALRHTLALLVIQVPVMMALALFLSVMLNDRRLRCKGLFRFAFFAPVVISEVGYSAIFRLLFNGSFGAVNSVLSAFGLPRPDWLNTPAGAMTVVVLAVTWRWTGYNTIILLAGLQNIPEDLYEAARLDGVSRLQQFAHITLPLLKPVMIFALSMAVFGSLQLFIEPQLITRSGPAGATSTLATYIYQQGFRNFNFGYAAAIGYTATLMALAVSSARLRLLERRT